MNHILFILVCIFTVVEICAAQSQSIVLVYTHNTNGVLENCDCPEQSYGALEKRAVVIDSIRKAEQNVLLLDTGDILDILQDEVLHNYVVKAYDYMKYDFWTPGDQDFVEGTDFFQKRLSILSATLLSTNIKYRKNLIGKKYAIVKFGTVKISIAGTINDDLYKYLDPESKEDYIFEDQLSSLAPVIDKLNQSSDFIVLLSHSGIERDHTIAKQYPSIDLIIGSHSQTILSKPEKIGTTFIHQVGESGYRIGIFKINFKNKKIDSSKSSVILLTKDMKEDSVVNKMIDDYHQERLLK